MVTDNRKGQSGSSRWISLGTMTYALTLARPVHPRRRLALLVRLAAVHVAGNQGQVALQPADPIFQISTRYLFWGVGACEFFVGMACLLASDLMSANLLLLWLTSSLVIYRLGLLATGVTSLGAYYQTTAHQFGVSTGRMNVLCGLATGSLWCGSALCVAVLWRSRNREEPLQRLKSEKTLLPPSGIQRRRPDRARG